VKFIIYDLIIFVQIVLNIYHLILFINLLLLLLLFLKNKNKNKNKIQILNEIIILMKNLIVRIHKFS